MTPRILHESAVLTPRDPTLETDDWLVFDLNDVTVVDPYGNPNEPANLLHAAAHRPLTVRGRLGKLPEDAAHACLIRNVQPSLAIELTDVRIYSYGTFDDGSAAVWAGGQAGWYLISPSPAYRAKYEEMQEAVKVLHFVADAYTKRQGKGKKAKSPHNYSAKELCEKYAAEKMRKAADATAGAHVMYRHRIFLLASMVQQREGVAWSQNPFYLHLKQKFHDEWEQVKRWLRGDPAPAPSTRPRGESIDSTSTSSSLKRKRGRPPAPQPVDVISLGSSSSTSSAAKGAPSKQPLQWKSKLVSSQTRSTRSQEASTPGLPPDTPDLPRSEIGAEDEDSDTDTNPPPRKGKSALRLKPSTSVKGPRRNARPPPEEDDVDEQDHLAPSPTAAAPPRHNHRTRHHTTTLLDLDEGISMPTSPSSDSHPASPGALDHIPDPIAEDTWRCALVGCTHRIYGASQPESQELIKKHYAMHASDDDDRVKLVQRLAQPSLPAGRLIERVRMQARCDLGGFEGSRVAGSRFPSMVVRRV